MYLPIWDEELRKSLSLDNGSIETTEMENNKETKIGVTEYGKDTVVVEVEKTFKTIDDVIRFKLQQMEVNHQ